MTSGDLTESCSPYGPNVFNCQTKVKVSQKTCAQDTFHCHHGRKTHTKCSLTLTDYGTFRLKTQTYMYTW